jgi:hypothetical protein
MNGKGSVSGFKIQIPVQVLLPLFGPLRPLAGAYLEEQKSHLDSSGVAGFVEVKNTAPSPVSVPL